MNAQVTLNKQEAVDLKIKKVAGTKNGFWIAEIETTFNPIDDSQEYNYQAMHHQTKIGPEFAGYGGFDLAEDEIKSEKLYGAGRS